eukprot:3168168-Prymnesium_polylepis.1
MTAWPRPYGESLATVERLLRRIQCRNTCKYNVNTMQKSLWLETKLHVRTISTHEHAERPFSGFDKRSFI